MPAWIAPGVRSGFAWQKQQVNLISQLTCRCPATSRMVIAGVGKSDMIKLSPSKGFYQGMGGKTVPTEQFRQMDKAIACHFDRTLRGLPVGLFALGRELPSGGL